MLFIGTPTGKYLNMALKRITEVYNKYFPYLDLPEPDRYTGALIYKGNFYNSFIEARYLFRSREYYNKTKVYTLKFNPFISEKEYNTLINSNQVGFWKLLNNSTHTKYRGSDRPGSMVIWGNETYEFFTYNCMHISAIMLSYGKLYRNSRDFQDEMVKIYFKDYYLPNSAFYHLKNGELYGKPSWMNIKFHSKYISI